MKAADINVGEIYAIHRKGPTNTLRHVARAVVVEKEAGKYSKIWYVVLRANETEAPEGAHRQWVRRRAVFALWVAVAPQIVEEWQALPVLRKQDHERRRAEIAELMSRRTLTAQIRQVAGLLPGRSLSLTEDELIKLLAALRS